MTDNTGGDPGDDTGGDPGDDTGGDPGDDTGGDPGDDTGGQPGDDASGQPDDDAGDPGENRPESDRHDWPVLESNVEYETGWYTGGYDLVEQPDGSTKRYYWAELPPAVVVVAVADDRVLMVEQYRPVLREYCLELPAGLVEDSESFTAAASRELREETGFDPAGVSLIEEFWVATGVLRHRRAIVWAEGLEPTERDLDANEFLSVRPIPVADALSMARARPANDATIEGLLLAREEQLIDH